MKQDNKRHLLEIKNKKFIELMIEASTAEEQIKAYQAIYPQCINKEAARVNSYKKLQEAGIKDAINEGKKKKEDEIRQAQKEERIRLAKEQVAHEAELDAQLSDIARGTRKRTRKVVVWNKITEAHQVVSVEEEPTETDIIAAADKLYKRKGSYAPVGIKHDASDPLMEIMKAVAQVGNKNIPNDIEPRADTEEV